jgi:hypothetical protein
MDLVPIPASLRSRITGRIDAGAPAHPPRRRCQACSTSGRHRPSISSLRERGHVAGHQRSAVPASPRACQLDEPRAAFMSVMLCLEPGCGV